MEEDQKSYALSERPIDVSSLCSCFDTTKFVVLLFSEVKFDDW